jgi:thiamine pyrophosphate-dependent acetolactate synthase large subunit-like protein
MIVELEKDVWIADLDEGDPPRTSLLKNAKEFDSIKEAASALMKARKFRPFKKAQITENALF